MVQRYTMMTNQRIPFKWHLTTTFVVARQECSSHYTYWQIPLGEHQIVSGNTY